MPPGHHRDPREVWLAVSPETRARMEAALVVLEEIAPTLVLFLVSGLALIPFRDEAGALVIPDERTRHTGGRGWRAVREELVYSWPGVGCVLVFGPCCWIRDLIVARHHRR